MVSCHRRPTFAAHAADPAFGALMVRYNAAHPGAEQDVFPQLPRPRPAVVAYTATSWGHLLDPRRLPPPTSPEERAPTAADCYRFALSHPSVDVCLAGPRDERELESAFTALAAGPLDPDERARLLRLGATVRATEKSPVPWLFALRRPRRASS
jgi:aryl-alcohol dehydrogenase-like predicted oxidoreductase